MRYSFLLGALVLGVGLVLADTQVLDASVYPAQPEHSFKGPFLQGGSSGLGDHWVLGGSAVLTDSFVRLTPAIKDRRGWIWAKNPTTYRNWDVEFEFKAAGGRPPGADGFAFWYAQTPEITGPIYGNADKWLGLGVIFDTYDNDRKNNNPYVLAMLNDGTINYDHNNDGLTNQLGGCVARYRSLPNPSRVRVIYKDNALDVLLDLNSQGQYDTCMHADNIHLPTGFYFGMSAATGALSDNHDIYSLTVRSLDKNTPAPGARAGEMTQPAPVPVAPAQPGVATAALPSFERGQRASLSKEKEAMLDQALEAIKTSAAFLERPLDPTNPQAPLTDAQRLEQVAFMSRALHKDMIVMGEMIRNVYGLHRDVLEHVALDKDVEALSVYMQQLQRAMSQVHDADTKGDIARMRDAVLERFATVTKDLNTRLDELHYKIVTVHGSLESANKEQDMIRHSIQLNQKQMEESIKKSSKWGFWSWFIVFQIVFAVAFILWKKNRDEQAKKLP
ncbi:putative Protein ERGIC-53 [Paratrimastix pyriformis]|uniref:L-type lectin-like domain-containing protein n=1 Tax=Paratrimastix pyriformis TaxID=342808 RepID=A0ABQ8URN2_9EUKA|nr:putative Protein ERGIC-53 [Paratrimastix pyriformis]